MNLVQVLLPFLLHLALLYAYLTRIVGIPCDDVIDMFLRRKKQGMISFHCRDPPD
jgi:hypothetical protein